MTEPISSGRARSGQLGWMSEVFDDCVDQSVLVVAVDMGGARPAD